MKEYSEDRRSLAQEIRGLLKARGAWCPDNDADLITALGRFAESRDLLVEALVNLATEHYYSTLRGLTQFSGDALHGEVVTALRAAGRLS